MFELSYKLRILKEKVKTWSKEETQRMKDKSVILENEINALLSSSPLAILKEDQHKKLLSLSRMIFRSFWITKYILQNSKVGLHGPLKVMQTPSIFML